MIRLSLLFILSLLAPSVARAGEDQPSPVSKDQGSAVQPAAPGSSPAPAESGKDQKPVYKPLEHLTHLYRDEEEGDYWALLRKRLIVTPGRTARMLSLPSFDGESCLAIDASGEGKQRKYSLTVTIAERNLYQSMVGDAGNPKPDEVKIRRIDRAISAELAAAIHRVWEKALSDVGNEGGREQVDGLETLFYAEIEGRGLLSGKVCSPQGGGMPERLIDLGYDLQKFASKKDGKEKAMLEEVRAFAKTMPEP